jgi:hypothetical protein
MPLLCLQGLEEELIATIAKKVLKVVMHHYVQPCFTMSALCLHSTSTWTDKA